MKKQDRVSTEDRLPRNAYGAIDTSDTGRKKFANKCKDNLEKWKGLTWFSKYRVWALNIRNAIKKANKRKHEER